MNELRNMQEMVLANPTSLMSEGVFSPNATPSQLETVSASKFPGFTSVGLMQGSEDILEVNGVKSAADVEAQLNATEAPRDACLQVQEISLNKRKRNVQDAEIEGQPLNKARKDSTVENQEKGEEESIHIIAQIGQTKTSHSYDVRIETIKEKKRTLQGLVPGCSKLTGAEALDEIINYIQSLQLQVEFLSMKLSAFHPISNGDAAITSNGDAAVTDFLLKLEADDESKVKLSDFVGLDGERILIGKYRFPLSLHPIIKNIIDAYGDVSATSKMNPTIVEAIYIMFCASIKEMSDLRLEKVTEGLILKWRDVIKDALCMNFKVDFAMEHLKKIASAYIGLMEHSKILKLEAQLSAMKEEHSKILERSKVFMDAAEDFNDKPVSSGMFLCARGVKQTLERTSNSRNWTWNCKEMVILLAACTMIFSAMSYRFSLSNQQTGFLSTRWKDKLSFIAVTGEPDKALHLDFSNVKHEFPWLFYWSLVYHAPSPLSVKVKTLHLKSVSFTFSGAVSFTFSGAVSSIMTKFKFLESLTIENCHGLRSLKIHARPNSRFKKLDAYFLQSLRFQGKFPSFQRGCVISSPWFWPLFDHEIYPVDVMLDFSQGSCCSKLGSCRFPSFFIGSEDIESLTLSCWCFKVCFRCL
ncbi:uncharacterized protein LOC120205309 [Hibiscus syriacus]|uniref:uncharacterized protein LOC120205309 n=1 Tax=Hibiscus syriacus TaxID=106335 RepID=UPI0019232304|nr:uncharacterized protein LOC120205309 [Hibiscus syriacus]